ncbi:Phage protein [Xylella phage Cota]|uniref:Phage protein n=1 Tax=Xylella phage Cota TaxID=2699877 RepID=A0A6F8ZJX7_9CAUD|nr:Phage protein [Xylella phage Cota]
MTKTNKIMDKAQIEKAIDSIAKQGKKLDGDIQAAAVGCINHIEACGDVRLFNRLFLAMPKGARKSALTQWALAFGKVEANTGDNKKEQPFTYAKDKTTDLAGAIGNPWYDFAPEKAPDEMFDVRKALTALLNRAGKAQNVNDAELLAKLRTLEPTE